MTKEERGSNKVIEAIRNWWDRETVYLVYAVRSDTTRCLLQSVYGRKEAVTKVATYRHSNRITRGRLSFIAVPRSNVSYVQVV